MSDYATFKSLEADWRVANTAAAFGADVDTRWRGKRDAKRIVDEMFAIQSKYSIAEWNALKA